MKHISPYPQQAKGKYKSEIINSEITDWSEGHRQLPRHISVPEIKSHRGRYNLNRIDYAPRVCRIDTYKPSTTNFALDILKYQLSDRAAQQKHLENLRSNLQRRLQAAQAKGDSQLINILQDEYQQLSR